MTARPAVAPQQLVADPAFKAAARQMWSLGDYHTFARRVVWEIGPMLVQACGVGPGQRVLDVAAGTGNVAIRAAAAGADVVASDLTPENFAAGQDEARLRGVELEWVEGDAEALPFGDDEFDVVLSSFGPIVAIRGLLEEQPERRAAFDRELLDFALRFDSGRAAGPAEYHYDYLLVVARTR